MKHVSVGDAFATLDGSEVNQRPPNHQQKTKDRIEGTEWGESLYESWGEKIRLDPNEVAPTLKGGKRPNYHFAHPYQNRGLTIRERAKLQSFPDWYEFLGPVTKQRRQTGNAVPPLLAEKVGEMI